MYLNVIVHFKAIISQLVRWVVLVLHYLAYCIFSGTQGTDGKL